MTEQEFNKLKHGIYRIYWTNDDSTSVAAIGSDYTGKRWMAPANWTAESDGNGNVAVAYIDRYDRIEKVEFITAQ